MNEFVVNEKKRILVVTAVAAEQNAVIKGLKSNSRFDVITVGVGPVAAAVNTAKALSSGDYGLVVIAGIAGGVSGKSEIASLVVANKIIAADLGAETPQGFCNLDELGFGTTCINVNFNLVKNTAHALSRSAINVNIGPILTVSTVTGSAESAEELFKRIPDAAAEAMEGFGAAFAAQEYGVPILEIRAISNMIGPRDRSAWCIKEALEILEKASAVFLEVF